MNTVLWIYTYGAFGEILLPAENNADLKVVLKKDVYELIDDVSLELEVEGKEWHLKESEKYRFVKKNGIKDDVLRNEDVIGIETENERFSIIVRKNEESFSVLQKYDISAMGTVSIGQEQNNHIIYQFLGLVSRHHAVIQKTAKGVFVRDISGGDNEQGKGNGVFVNFKKIAGIYELKIGDCINIFGLKIVYFGE
ncbi:MAG: FHA domain-containing protein, partial [Lachnospiraceae bacterium]|nr:FHA domain-containing protein [Lachnospiraceae bacterium]